MTIRWTALRINSISVNRRKTARHPPTGRPSRRPPRFSASVDFLPGVITAPPAHRGGLDRWAVPDRSTGLGLFADPHPHFKPQLALEALPRAIVTPVAKVIMGIHIL